MNFVLAIIFFTLGLIIGSFLNVVILRFNTSKSLGGRSACMACQNTLSWFELLPLFSFLGLQGRCRNCKTRISLQYPLVEAASGIIFLELFFKFQNIFFTSPLVFSITYAYYAVLFSLLLVIAVYDIKHKIIPDTLSLLFGLLAFVGLFFFTPSGLVLHMPSLLNFLSGILMATPFTFFWLISSGRWMGLGDAKLTLGIGWMLGIAHALSALVIAFWSGAVIGILLIALSRKKYGMKSEIPFAPYLVLGTFIAFVFSLNLFGI